MHFEWDDKKNQSNIKKHGIAFEEAQTIFYDEQSIIFDDPDHSNTEERFIIVGFSNYGKLLLSCFCERHKNVIRIFSARRLTRKEKNNFKQRWQK